MESLNNFTTNNLKEVLVIIKEQEYSDLSAMEMIDLIKQVILTLTSNKV